MLIENLNRREGTSEISLGKIKYLFQPVYEYDEKTKEILPGPTTSWCQVDSEEHIKHLLRSPQFREYDQKPRFVKRPPPNPLAGYSFDKLGEAGYIVKGPRGFAGADGSWRKTKKEIPLPFVSMIDAETWLKEQLADGLLEEEEKKEKK